MEKISVSKNQQQWEKFAKKDALFYIDTNAKNPGQFWKKGENNFQAYILPILKKYHIKRNVGIDFGCGIGRHTFPLAGYFQMMYGVDVSDRMLKQARAVAHEKNIANVQFILNAVFFSDTKPVDFIYCVNVFQHIENIEQIKSILDSFSRLLHGFAYVQFDTRSQNLLYRLKNKMPDFLLPRSQRRGIRRIRRVAKEIENIIKKMGFAIIEQRQPNSEYHFFLLQK